MIKIAICDDDKKITTQLEDVIEDYLKQLGIRYEINIFFDGKELMQHMEKEQTEYDVIFLDIEMKDMDGMETARQIRKKNQIVLILFVTSHTSYAIEAYSVHPFQFIVKPIDEKIVCDYFQQAYEVITAGEFYYEYKYNKEYYRILVNDIMYFESEKRMIRIYLKDGIIKQYYDKLNLIQEKFQDSKADFWRIHQSILVNSRYVVKKAFDYIELTNGKRLSISEDRRREINAHYVEKIGKTMGD
ncbi:MAG: response regulator transcription factor [Lachnospiraceae bacterium]|nr:response regulator transcription factor [Lachnospiraceae bacterium]